MANYNKIEIYPNQTIDYLIQIKDTATNEDIAKVNEKNFIPDWNTFLNRTNIMAPYTNSLVSSFITGLTEELLSWGIYRQKIGESSLKKIGEINKSAIYLDDYGVSNQASYKYFVFPVTESQIGINLATNEVSTNWWNWSVTSLKQIDENIYAPKEVWIFDTNLQSGEVTQNLDIVYHNNFTKYPKESRGDMNYITGSISCLLSNIESDTGEYIEPIEKLKAWRDFCADNSLKVIKDRKGNIRLVSLSDTGSSILDESEKQPTTITFSYTEIGDIDKISVYEEVI